MTSQICKFAIVGVLNTGIDFALFGVLYSVLTLPLIIANTVAYCAGVLNGFLWNKYWTFSECHAHGCIIYQLPLFFACYAIGLGLSNLTIWFLSPLMPVLVAKILAIGLACIWNFWSSRRFVYGATAF